MPAFNLRLPLSFGSRGRHVRGNAATHTEAEPGLTHLGDTVPPATTADSSAEARPSEGMDTGSPGPGNAGPGNAGPGNAGPGDAASRRGHPPARWRRTRSVLIYIGIAMVTFAGGAAVHVVTPGETLAVIASKHGTTVAELVDLNDITNANLIIVGQRLTLPGGESQQVHVVASGDTVGEIAARYTTSVSAIVEANGLRNANLIKIGQRLLIPQSGTNGEDAPLYHVVQRGESLASIAAKYGIGVETVAAANGMDPDSIIYVGTRLRLSPGPERDVPPSQSNTHIVQSGESLGTIAARYNTSINRLVELNNISNPNLIRAGQRLVVSGSGFVCPVPGSTFFNDWGFPRSGGRFHEGNDMFAPGGSPVLAPVSGRVEHVNGSIGGLQFWLYGDDGDLYIGTHMSSFGASGRVTAGTVVGTVGDSGNARGARPHLHFEVMVGGEENINPYPMIAKACR